MGIATVYVIPTKSEWIFWLAIFLICAYIIAKNAPGNYFLHGFLVSIVNSIWITAVHVIMFSTYVANHPDVVEMNKKMPMLAEHPKRLMAIMGPIIGVISGLVLGLFAFLASKMVKRPPQIAR